MFKVGFSVTNINPPLGIGVAGYYVPRFAKGFLSDMEVRCLALSDGNEKAAMISCDLCYIETAQSLEYRNAIEKATGIPEEKIFLSATHTHTSGLTRQAPGFQSDPELINEYSEFVKSRLIDAVTLAFSDLKPARMGYAVGKVADRTSYIRRYKMKDGSTMTCPPVGDPDIDYPLGEIDTRVNVVRFDRDGGDTIVLVNYGLHADTVNGELISSDWPGWMYKTVEKALDNTRCIHFYGAAGDVGSTHVFPDGGDMNDTEISFDNEMKSPGMARFIGRAMAGTVLQVFDKVHYVDTDKLKTVRYDLKVKANVPDEKDLPLAHKYKKLHDEGRDDEIPYEAMELTTVVAEACRMCRLEHGPEEFTLNLMGISFGGVAFVGIPGEPFTDTGKGIKDTDGWNIILPCALVNGHEGYFPMKSAYDEGGYEARSSRYKAGIAERLIDGGKTVLGKLKSE